MKIAIYHPWIYVKSGLERTIMEIKKRSHHDWDIYTSHFDADGTYPELGEMGIIELEKVSVKRNYFHVVKAAVKVFTTRIDTRKYDALVICCDGIGSLLAFNNRSIPLICLCFTPLRAVYDQEYRKRHLEKHRKLLPFALMLELAYKVIDRMAWRNYQHVFAISHVVKKRLLEGSLCETQNIEVAYPGIDEDKIAPSPVRENYFFLPGRIMWTKNIELAVDAFLDFYSQQPDRFRLVVAGMVDRKSQPYLETLMKKCHGNNDIQFIQGLSDSEMARYYNNCYAVLFTAFNEDLGLTPLEAMTHGKPVIAVNRGGPTEIVAHGETGLLVENDPKAFSDAMEYLVHNPDVALRMGENGMRHCRSFGWQKFVHQLDDYLDKEVVRPS